MIVRNDYRKVEKELEKMRAAGQLVGTVLQNLTTLVEPGITTLEIVEPQRK